MKYKLNLEIAPLIIVCCYCDFEKLCFIISLRLIQFYCNASLKYNDLLGHEDIMTLTTK